MLLVFPDGSLRVLRFHKAKTVAENLRVAEVQGEWIVSYDEANG